MIIEDFVCVCFYCPSSYYISLRSLICILSVIIAEEVEFHFNSLICSHLFLFTSFAVSHCFDFAVVVVACFDIFFFLCIPQGRETETNFLNHLLWMSAPSYNSLPWAFWSSSTLPNSFYLQWPPEICVVLYLISGSQLT